jgi:hypothetical protein
MPVENGTFEQSIKREPEQLSFFYALLFVLIGVNYVFKCSVMNRIKTPVNVYK